MGATPMIRIAIVGAGLSGRLLALHLLRQAKSPISIVLIDRGDERWMGPAYSDDADYLLLNVPAGRMGAFSDDPAHFLKWVRHRGVAAGEWDFLARGLYRTYILDLLAQARHECTSGAQLEHVCGDVIDIETTSGRAAVHLRDNKQIAADSVVLAFGNFPPRDPHIEHKTALEGARYVRNAWDAGALNALSSGDTVVFIGTGQTTVDLAVALNRRAHRGRIVAISRHGVLPMAHRGFEPYPSFYDEIAHCTKVLDLMKALRRHSERAPSSGMDMRNVIDSLRPDTQRLWQNFPNVEKRRFVRHVFRHWEIVRSRIPPQNESAIEAMRASGQLAIVAGRIRDLIDSGAAIEVHYTSRSGTRNEIETAGLVINCSGPESDYGRVDDNLVNTLMRRGLIRRGPADLGIDASPSGAIVSRDGISSPVLYTIGSPMKGVLWEVLAVPDIRVQAKRLAHELL